MMEVNTSEAIESAPADRNNDSIIQSTSSATTVETVIKKPEWLTLGLPVLLLFFSWNLCGTVFQNQVLFQTCTSYFNYNQSLCYELTDSLADDSDLQVSNIFNHWFRCQKQTISFSNFQLVCRQDLSVFR